MASAAKVIPFVEPAQVVRQLPIIQNIPWRVIRARARRHRIARRARFCRIVGGR